MQTTEAERVSIRSYVGPAILLFAIAVVVPVYIAQHYDALGIPRSDDWSYLHTLFLWERTGSWDFNDWVSMTLVGQLFVSLPITAIWPESITALSVTWAVIGFGGLLAVVAIGRALGRPPRDGFLVALCMAACPLWGALAPTFMTDVPTFAFDMFTLALGVFALRRKHAGLLVAATIVGFVAIAIRQYAVIPIGAVLLVAVWQARVRNDRRWFRLAVGLLVGLGIATLLLMAWWFQVPNAKSLGPRFPNISSTQFMVANIANLLRLAGLILLPVVVYANPRRVIQGALRTDRLLTLRLLGGTAALLALGWLLAPDRVFVGNYMHIRGVLGDDIIAGTRPFIMPQALFVLLTLAASCSAIVLVAAAVPFVCEVFVAKTRSIRTIGTGDPVVATLGIMLAGFAVVYPIATFLRMGFSDRTAVFDRYALPFLPLIGLLFLRSVALRGADDDVIEPIPNLKRTRALTALSLGMLVLLGFVYASESASFDATRWALAEEIVDQGYSPLQIHAGYEWEGWYSGQGPRTSDSIAVRRALRAKYFQGMCVTIAIAPRRLPAEYLAIGTSDALTRKPTTLVAVRAKRSCEVPPGRGDRGEKSPR